MKSSRLNSNDGTNMIDGKALYIHRANFQIIDKSLLN